MRDGETRRPATGHVAQHVAFGVGILAGDQPDAAGQQRQRAFAVGIEQALGLEFAAPRVQLGQQPADPRHPQLQAFEAERRGGFPHPRFQAHRHLRPLRQRARRIQHEGRGRHRAGDVGEPIPQGEELGGCGAAFDLDDLRLHPDLAEPAHPVRDRTDDSRQRLRMLGRTGQGHVREPTHAS